MLTTNGILHFILMKVIFSVLILWIAFGNKLFHHFWTSLFVFYGLYMFVGGAMLLIHFMMNPVVGATTSVYKQISVTYVLSVFPVVAFATKKQADFFLRKKFTNDSLYHVSLSLNGRGLEGKGLLDTGNQLYDPLLNKPVIFANSKLVRQAFSVAEWEQLKTVLETKNRQFIPKTLQKQLVMIPYQDVSGVERTIVAVKARYVTIHSQKHTYTLEDIPVGLQLNELTVDGSYDCLLHPHFITHGKN